MVLFSVAPRNTTTTTTTTTPAPIVHPVLFCRHFTV